PSMPIHPPSSCYETDLPPKPLAVPRYPPGRLPYPRYYNPKPTPDLIYDPCPAESIEKHEEPAIEAIQDVLQKEDDDKSECESVTKLKNEDDALSEKTAIEPEPEVHEEYYRFGEEKEEENPDEGRKETMDSVARWVIKYDFESAPPPVGSYEIFGV
ncbi:hypothetical protein PFISCL1PPCAC_27460, partial [Pristionchus fissidentatus]